MLIDLIHPPSSRAASQASGPNFYYLKRAAALLEIALIQYAMKKAVARGFQPIITPDIIKDHVVVYSIILCCDD